MAVEEPPKAGGNAGSTLRSRSTTASLGSSPAGDQPPVPVRGGGGFRPTEDPTQKGKGRSLPHKDKALPPGGLGGKRRRIPSPGSTGWRKPLSAGGFGRHPDEHPPLQRGGPQRGMTASPGPCPYGWASTPSKISGRKGRPIPALNAPLEEEPIQRADELDDYDSPEDAPSVAKDISSHQDAAVGAAGAAHPVVRHLHLALRLFPKTCPFPARVHVPREGYADLPWGELRSYDHSGGQLHHSGRGPNQPVHLKKRTTTAPWLWRR